MILRFLRAPALGALALIALAERPAQCGDVYLQTNLITSATDPDLINPWGISYAPTGPFWVSDNGTGKSTLYNTAGAKLGLVVSMPNADPITGQVFNGSANFNADRFIFASEAGTIAGWRGALGTNAENLYTVADAVYKGLAISGPGDQLFAANFHSGTIDVFDSTHSAPIGSFSDAAAPAGYAPFNIQNIGGQFFVTFAKQDAAGHDDVSGVGHGYVAVFDPSTHTFTHLITGSDAGGTESHVDSPWGLAIAPSTFGVFGGALLVGNFGDGKINAFDQTNGQFLGTLLDSGLNPIVNPGLWGMTFGNGGLGGKKDILYITAGGANEDQGVFAQIQAVPEPAAILAFSAGAGVMMTTALRRRRARA